MPDLRLPIAWLIVPDCDNHDHDRSYKAWLWHTMLPVCSTGAIIRTLYL